MSIWKKADEINPIRSGAIRSDPAQTAMISLRLITRFPVGNDRPVGEDLSHFNRMVDLALDLFNANTPNRTEPFW